MKNMLQHPEFGQIRIQKVKDDFVYCAKDICDTLGLTHTTNALAGLDEDETMTVKILHASKMREMLFVTESGLYALIIRSNKPEAKRFRKWVTAEVLPSLRKYGVYTTDPKAMAAAQKLRDTRAKKALFSEIGKNVTISDKRLIGKQSRTSETYVNKVLRSELEDVTVAGLLFKKAVQNKDTKEAFYTADGAEELLKELTH